VSEEVRFTFQASPGGVMLNIPINPALNLSVFIPLELMKAMSRDIAKSIKQQEDMVRIVSDVKRGA
jgi:hypothetical protein